MFARSVKLMNRWRNFALLGLGLALVAGCGGGGSSGGDSTVVIPQAPIAITQANAVDVASIVMFAGGNPFADYTPASVAQPASVVTDPSGARDIGSSLAGVISTLVQRIAPAQVQTVVTIAIVVPATPLPCAVSGTLTISGEVSDPTGTTFTTGDTVKVTFKNCDDGDGVILNGTISMVFQQVIGNTSFPPYDYTVAVTMTNFSITAGGQTLGMNGNAVLREVTDDGILFSTEFSTNSLRYTESAGDTGLLTSYFSEDTENLNTLEYTTHSSGTLATVLLGGSVQFTALTPFEGIAPDFPHTGVMRIVGEGSSETVTAVDAVNVTIDVDENGDNIVDVTIDTTWQALQ